MNLEQEIKFAEALVLSLKAKQAMLNLVEQAEQVKEQDMPRGVVECSVADIVEQAEQIEAQEDKPWYEDIPEGGIECYVSDADKLPSSNIMNIIEYHQGEEYPFRALSNQYPWLALSDLWWEYATPTGN